VYPSPVPMPFRWDIIAVVAVNSVLTYMYEKIVVWYVSLCWKNRNDKKKEREFKEQLMRL
jgi:hypothetical protein